MKRFHIVFVGCALPKFSRLMHHVRAECDYGISYVVTSAKDVSVLLSSGVAAGDIYHIDERQTLPDPRAEEIEYLSSLEQGAVPTIHNMILSDSVISKLPYADAIAYAAHLARAFRSLYRELRPSVVIGGHDRMQSSMGFAVAKAEAIPWFALNFSVLPMGYVALSPGIVPDETVCLRDWPVKELRELTAKLLEEFERGRLRAPAYLSAYNIRMVARRLNEHIGEAVRSIRAQYFSRLDKYNEHRFGMKLRQYLRKRKNMFLLPREWFVKEPPAEPFIFFGLHMQPESTIDVYAPFYANQFDVIEKIARAMPPTHRFLIKLHISDADNYSRKQLRSLSQLPGVRLVLPNVSSREFIDKCAAVVTIAGTMGLEGALLGKPVVIFCKMNYEHFPSVTRVLDIYDLPKLLRRRLSEERPPREAILEAYQRYLNTYFRAAGMGATEQLNNWTDREPSQEALEGFVELFRALDMYLDARVRGVRLADVKS